MTRVFSGSSPGRETRRDSKTAPIISTMAVQAPAQHLVSRPVSIASIRSVMAATYPPS
ncbi:MAG TPA: hypothetical protein VMZ71_04915 [Gemmataceae bacterium]|nr:hypothetical protein [Gemmataceae bacterium]